jgi:uncharacterized protein YodC (DUF2158 family)
MVGILKKGDRVQPKGGGQNMHVDGRRDGSIECYWFVNGKQERGCFSEESLELIVETPALVPVSSQLKPLPSKRMHRALGRRG